MRIGELAEQASISTKAIRYYEQSASWPRRPAPPRATEQCPPERVCHIIT